MKIAWSGEYVTHLDGVNRFIALLAKGLAELGPMLYCMKLKNLGKVGVLC